MEKLFVLYVPNSIAIGAKILALLDKAKIKLQITSEITDVANAYLVIAVLSNVDELKNLLLNTKNKTIFILLKQSDFSYEKLAISHRIDAVLDFKINTIQEVNEVVQLVIEQHKNQNLSETTDKIKELNNDRLAKENYLKVLENLQVGVWDWQYNNGNELEWWSTKTYNLLEYGAQEFELTTKKFISLIHPEDLDLFEHEKMRYLKDQDVFHVQLRMRKKFGEFIWLDISGKGTFSKKGKPLRITGCMVDINSIKNQELNVIFQKKQFENYIESSPTAIFLVQDEKLVYLNAASRCIMEIDEELPIGFKKFVHTDFEKAFFEQTDKLRYGKISQVRFVAKLRTGKGKAIFADLTLGVTIHNGKGAFIGTGIDITQQKNAIDNLKLSEALLAESQKVTKTGTFIINRKTKEIWWSKQLYKLLLKNTDEQIKFADFLTYIHQDDGENFIQKIIQALDFGYTGSFNFKLLYPHNQTIFCQTKLTLLENNEILQGTIQDVSEYKIYEKKIFEQAQLNTEILNSFPIEIVIYNKEMKFEYANKKAIANDELRNYIIGKTDVEYFQKSGKNFINANERVQKIQTVIDTQRDINWVECQNIGNKSLYFLRGLFPIVENGEIIKIVGSSLDLTKELEAEESLKFRIGFENLLINISNSLINISSDKLEDVLRNAIKKIGEFADVDRVYIFKYKDYNLKMDNTHEWCSEGTKPFLEFLQDIDITRFDWLYQELAKKEAIVIDYLDQLPIEAHKEKLEFIKEGIKSIILMPIVVDKKVNGFIGFDSVRRSRKWSLEIADLIKLTAQIVSSALERRKSVGALVQSEEKFRTLTESAHAGIFISTNSRLVYANPEAVILTGYNHDEILTKNIIDILHPDEKPSAIEIMGRIMSSENYNSRNERKLITKNGEIRHIDITSNKIIYNGENAMISIAFDVTEKHKKDEERNNLIQQLTRQNDDLEQFSYITSHNLRSPVAGIKGLISIIEREYLGSNFNENVIQRIDIAAQKLDQVIKDLNDIISVKKQFNQKRQTIVLEDLVNEIIESHTELLSKRLVDISFDFSEAPSINTVKGYLQSILTNLVTNAIKYCVQGKKALVQIKSTKTPDFLELSVQDNGMGIDLIKHGKKLFKYKQRFHLNIEGQGIGLYLVKTQTEALGGVVEVESTVNKGSKFIIKLPNLN